MSVLTDGLESAFERSGGVPEELLFDQMRAVVVSDDRAGGGELILNTEFPRFAAHYVGGVLKPPLDLLVEIRVVGKLPPVEEAPARHTTGECPVDRFQREERDALQPLADRPSQRLGADPSRRDTAQALARALGGGTTAAERLCRGGPMTPIVSATAASDCVPCWPT